MYFILLCDGLMNMQPGRRRGNVAQAGRRKEEDEGMRKQVEGKVITRSFNVTPDVDLSPQEVKPQVHKGVLTPLKYSFTDGSLPCRSEFTIKNMIFHQDDLRFPVAHQSNVFLCSVDRLSALDWLGI